MFSMSLKNLMIYFLNIIDFKNYSGDIAYSAN
jgi:hypothetical protein